MYRLKQINAIVAASGEQRPLSSIARFISSTLEKSANNSKGKCEQLLKRLSRTAFLSKDGIEQDKNSDTMPKKKDRWNRRMTKGECHKRTFWIIPIGFGALP